MYVSACADSVRKYSLNLSSASSTVSPDEKIVVVANLYDGLDWYKIPDRSFSRSVPLRINHNVPIPVLLVDMGNTLLVGGTSGSVKVLDAHTAETIQMLDHDCTKLQAFGGQSFHTLLT